MFRYAVFFMTSQCCCEVRQITEDDTMETVVIPQDTQFFFFVTTEFGIDVVRALCSCEKFVGLFEEQYTYRYISPIEDNTLYFIGNDNGYIIYNGCTGKYVYNSSLSGFTEKIEVINPDRLKHQTFPNKGKKETEFWVSKPGWSKGMPDCTYNKLELKSDGSLEGSCWDRDNGLTCNVFYKYDALIAIIKTVAREHPGVYQAIIDHVDPEEHIYYKALVDFCKEQMLCL